MVPLFVVKWEWRKQATITPKAIFEYGGGVGYNYLGKIVINRFQNAVTERMKESKNHEKGKND